jgi:hemerythrin-like domain-containing protein
MNAIEQLRLEHDGIKLMMSILNTFCDRLENGEDADLDDGVRMIEFFRIYADKYHHEKEEQLLFPLLEKLGVPRKGGPIEEMLHDHDLGRGYIRGMVEAMDKLREGDAGAGPFAENARWYIHLLEKHIEMEDDALFDLAEMRLSDAEQQQLAADFDMVKKMNMGSGKHEEFHALLEELERKYQPG